MPPAGHQLQPSHGHANSRANFEAKRHRLQKAFAVNAADLLGHSKEVGSIKPGKYADVIAVSGDPLKDVSVLENVEFVMKNGTVYKQPKSDACVATSNSHASIANEN